MTEWHAGEEWEPSDEWETSSELLAMSLRAVGFPVRAVTLPVFHQALADAVQADEVEMRIWYYAGPHAFRRYEYMVRNGEERAWLDRLIAADAERRLAA